MSKKLSIGSLVRVKSHYRGGKMVKAHTRGSSSKAYNPSTNENSLVNLKKGIKRLNSSGGSLNRSLNRRAKGILKVSEMVHAVGNPTNKSLKSIVNKHKEDYNHNSKYIRRGIDRNGYKGGKKMGYILDAVASKRVK